jgi:hypothetical protein
VNKIEFWVCSSDSVDKNKFKSNLKKYNSVCKNNYKYQVLTRFVIDFTILDDT